MRPRRNFAALLDPDRLSASVRAALQASEKELWLSPISACEATLLAERGRLRVVLDAQMLVWNFIHATFLVSSRNDSDTGLQ